MKRILKVFGKGGDKKTKKSSNTKYQKKLQSPTGTLTITSYGVAQPDSSLNGSLYTSNTSAAQPQPGEQISSIMGVHGSTGKCYTKTTQRIPAPGGGGIATVHEDKMEDSGGAVTPPPPTAAGQQTSDEQQDADLSRATIELTRNLVKKFIADIWNRGEIDLIPEVCSPSLRFNGNTGFDRVGHDGLARMVATIRDALDDYHCEIHSMVVEHNKAFCRLRFTGKHTGHLLGYPPTGKVVAWMGATEFTCQNGRILKVWELGDIKTLEEQLTPAAPAGSGNGAEEPMATPPM
jgi:steroid delta-isomerase-like uncharacterized protein